MLVSIGIAVFAVLALLAVWQANRMRRRAEYLREFALPPGLYAKLAARRPGLTLKDQQLVGLALRRFFLANLAARGELVSMPSQVVDDLWHELILYTRWYDAFCRKAFGRFLHHTPAVALSPAQRDSNAGLRRAFWLACKEENINPKSPTRLPLLFAIDAKLGIADGFRYTLDCSGIRRGADAGVSVQCASDFGSASVDGSTDGFGDGEGGGGDGGGCGGGGD